MNTVNGIKMKAMVKALGKSGTIQDLEREFWNKFSNPSDGGSSVAPDGGCTGEGLTPEQAQMISDAFAASSEARQAILDFQSKIDANDTSLEDKYNDMKTYTDSQDIALKAYIDGLDITGNAVDVDGLKAYISEMNSNLMEYMESVNSGIDAQVLSQAKAYTDSKTSGLLGDAESYTNSKVTASKSVATKYTNQKFTEADTAIKAVDAKASENASKIAELEAASAGESEAPSGAGISSENLVANPMLTNTRMFAISKNVPKSANLSDTSPVVDGFSVDGELGRKGKIVLDLDSQQRVFQFGGESISSGQNSDSTNMMFDINIEELKSQLKPGKSIVVAAKYKAVDKNTGAITGLSAELMSSYIMIGSNKFNTFYDLLNQKILTEDGWVIHYGVVRYNDLYGRTNINGDQFSNIIRDTSKISAGVVMQVSYGRSNDIMASTVKVSGAVAKVIDDVDIEYYPSVICDSTNFKFHEEYIRSRYCSAIVKFEEFNSTYGRGNYKTDSTGNYVLVARVDPNVEESMDSNIRNISASLIGTIAYRNPFSSSLIEDYSCYIKTGENGQKWFALRKSDADSIANLLSSGKLTAEHRRYSYISFCMNSLPLHHPVI